MEIDLRSGTLTGIRPEWLLMTMIPSTSTDGLIPNVNAGNPEEAHEEGDSVNVKLYLFSTEALPNIVGPNYYAPLNHVPVASSLESAACLDCNLKGGLATC